MNNIRAGKNAQILTDFLSGNVDPSRQMIFQPLYLREIFLRACFGRWKYATCARLMEIVQRQEAYGKP